jgi:hypothetical protein
MDGKRHEVLENAPRPEHRLPKTRTGTSKFPMSDSLQPSSIAGSNILLVDSSCRGLDAIHPEYESRRVRVGHAVAANVFCKAGHVTQRNF